MKKTLRTLLLLLFTMLSSMSYGQAIFDFDANGGKGAVDLFGMKGQSSKDSSDGDITSDVQATVDNITITVSPTTANTPNRIWSKPPCVLRMYGGKMTVSSADKNITKIVFALNGKAGSAKWAATVDNDNGTLSEFVTGKTTEMTWTGDAKKIVLTVAKNTQFSKITVYTGEGGGTVTPPVVEVVEAKDIAAFKDLTDGTVAKLTLTDAQVLYSWTSNNNNTQTFVRDATGALMLFNTGLELRAGQMLDGSVTLKKDVYNGTVEAVKADETNADNYTVAEGKAEPKVIEVTEAGSHLFDLVKLTNVNIVSEVSGKYTKYYAVSGDNKVQLYNGFHLDGYELAVAEGVDIVGIVSQFKGTPQIQPVEEPLATGIEAMELIESTDAPVYNLSGQRVGAAYKGVVIKNGKKYIQK